MSLSSHYFSNGLFIEFIITNGLMFHINELKMMDICLNVLFVCRAHLVS